MQSLTPRVLVPALLLSAAPGNAQQRDWMEYDGPRRLELAVTAGLFLSTDWSDLVLLESFNPDGSTQRQVLLREFAMAPDFGGSASVTYWRGRHGFRVHVGYVHSCATARGECIGTSLPLQSTIIGDTVAFPAFPRTEIEMNTWVYGVQGIVGLIEYSRDQWFRPYLILGAGGVTYDLDFPLSVVLPGPITSTGPTRLNTADETVFLDDPTTFLIATDEVGLENMFGFNVGIGTDLRIPIGTGGFSIRLELSDHITGSPLDLRVARLDGGVFRLDRDILLDRGIDEIRFDGRSVHNWRLSAGIAIEFGLNGPTSNEPEF